MRKNPLLLYTGIVVTTLISCKKMISPSPFIRKLETVVSSNYQKGDFAFSLSNLRKLTQARSVNSGKAQIIPSHLYVRFKPQTQQHISSIEENNIPTYPYPLATDSLDISNPDYSTLYTFLPMSKLLPSCPYEILDTVMMLLPESIGAAEAFAVAGKADRIPLADDAAVPRSAYIDLQSLPYDQWNDAPEIKTTLDSEDNLPSSLLSASAPLRPADPRSTPATVSYNSCSMNTDVNYPSGRITVEETQWGNGGVAYEGVADIKVEVLGPNGQRVIAYTNRYGCFKATGAIRGFRLPFRKRLPVIQNIVFKSGRKEIRGMNRTVVEQYTKPLLHIYGNIAKRMNNANVSYERHTSVDGNDTKYYVAATVNNALYEFDEYAAQDGILPPPNGIKVLVTAYTSVGSAPMLNDLKSRNVWDAAVVGNYLNTRAGGLGGILAPSAPDIIFGYKFSAEKFATDQIKETAYHEFSHASHYRKTSTKMWIDNIKFVADHKGYGNAGDKGVERTDLIEMWGYFMGREYAHRRYGPNAHSLSTPVNFQTSWYAYNENRYWPNDNASIFESDNHIAAGFLHDICDDNTYNIPRSLDEHLLITSDNISGYKISSIYSFLDGSTTSANTLINKLSNQLPTGQAISNFNTLKSLYGY